MKGPEDGEGAVRERMLRFVPKWQPFSLKQSDDCAAKIRLWIFEDRHLFRK